MLSILDILLALLFLGGVAVAGNLFWRSTKPDDYFLGGRALPWIAVLASIVATETSTLTFIGAPAISYAGDVSFIQLAAGYIIGRVLIAYLILPGYFKGKYHTAYELLSISFGDTTRRLASAVFIITRTLADGVRLYASALVVSVVLGIEILPAIAAISALTLLYTLRGGLVAVVWTDFMQLFVYLGGAIFSVFLLFEMIPGGVDGIFQTAVAFDKLNLFDLSIISSNPYTLPAGIAGGAFLSMASHGTDHLMVQRLMASKDLGSARRALIGSGIFVFIQFALFLLIGLALFAFYLGHPRESFSGKPDEVFPFFIVREIPSGARGLIVAAIMASAVSTLSSSLNSLASSTYGDFLKPVLSRLRGGSWLLMWLKRGESAVGRTLTLAWCIVLLLVSVLAQNWGGVLETGLAIASFTYGSLLGAFLLSILGLSGGERAVPVGMLTGIASMAAVFFLTDLPWTWYVVVGTVITVTSGSLVSKFLGS
ncbi:MAG: sodium:solute symporter [Candidatus Glassbacteria bacterium]